ncbi:MAG TPA: NAD(P)/FAD-dependent oxidoreductase [Vicinamibacterales bacterium]|nr:NAD(P)/FAD-dependent oxidoreductase [Vicinamibacterales bacterium]
MDTNKPKTHVVIVGGGFAGLGCARTLAKAADVRITLIDKNNYHQFQPLLYQVATAELGTSDVATSLRQTFRDHPNVDVKMSEVMVADPKSRTVTTRDGQQYQGDFLVLAAGSQANFFHTEGAEQHSFPLYSLEEAERLRSRIIAVFEDADRDSSVLEKGALNFVIIGGGPTGTELAGALADMINLTMTHEYPDLAVKRAQIYLVEHGTSLLAPFSAEAHDYAARTLQRKGVRLLLGRAVTDVAPDRVTLSDGTSIQTRTVVWAGGLMAAPLANNSGLRRGHGGRIEVQPDLTVEGFPGVYALGDFANVPGADGQPLPQLASVGQQCGVWTAKNIQAEIAGKPRTAFHYHDKGIMAMIGRDAAVAEIGRKRHELDGAIAFAAWLGVHALLMSGVRERVEAFIDWGWNYFSKTRPIQVLDRSNENRIDWGEHTETTATH